MFNKVLAHNFPAFLRGGLRMKLVTYVVIFISKECEYCFKKLTTVRTVVSLPALWLLPADMVFPRFQSLSRAIHNSPGLPSGLFQNGQKMSCFSCCPACTVAQPTLPCVPSNYQSQNALILGSLCQVMSVLKR